LHWLAALARRFEFASGSMGFVIGLYILTWDNFWPFRPTGAPRDNFLRSPEAMVWVFLIAAQFAFWFTALPVEWYWRSAVRNTFQVHFTLEMWAKLVLALLLFALPATLMAGILPATHVIAHHHSKILIVNLVSVLAAFVAVEGIWYVRSALGVRSWSGNTAIGGQPEKDTVKDYLLLRESLHQFITFLGAMIGLATLAKGASRHAFVATGGSPADYPPEYVLLHGAYFTGLLALVYMPTFSRLMDVGKDLLDSILPLSPDLDLKNLTDWQAKRKDLEELLQLRANALENLRASVSILAPLASSAISILVGDKLMLQTK
jgi:hypothetical protein